MRVLPPHGEPVSPEVLSRGTQEQLYLALRLAHIRNHAAQAAALPVIMDDNYFTLLRGETRKVDIEIDESLLGEDTYKLVARPYND